MKVPGKNVSEKSMSAWVQHRFCRYDTQAQFIK